MPKNISRKKENIPLNKLMNDFLYFKKAQGMAKRTISDYSNTFTKFKSYYDSGLTP